MADGSRAVERFDAREICNVMSISKRAIEMRAAREEWSFTEEPVRGGRRRLYALAYLPADVQDAIRRHRAIAAAEAIQPGTGSAAFQAGSNLGRKLAIAASVDAAVITRQREQGNAAAAGLSGKRKARMDAKVELLQRLATFAQARGLKLTASMVDFCEAYNSGALTVPLAVRQHTGAELHPGTLRRWRKLHNEQGPAALAGNYGNRAGSSAFDTDPELREFVIGLLADKPHISAKLVRDAVDARFGDTDKVLLSARSVERWLKKWKEENAEVFMAATNPDAWKNKYMAGFGSLTEHITRACQLWQLDSSPADLLLEDGRYSLIAVIDLAWRGLRLHVSKNSTAEAVTQIMRRAIIEWGVPETIKVDNGRDYASHRVGAMLNNLHVDYQFSAPFSPWEKGNVERAFRSFSHSLLEILPGYIGHNVAEAQAIRAREAFADRLFKKNEVVEVKLTAAQLQDFCDRWCMDYYAHEEHQGLDGETPFARYAQLRDVVRRVGDVRALDLLLGDGKTPTVVKKGLRIDNLWYIAPELSSVIGQKVLARVDDADIGRAVVYHDEQFLCIAECPEVLGVSRREIAIEAKAQQTKRVQEAKADLRKAKRKAKTRDIAWEILDHKAKKNAALTTMPAPNVLHMTPALEAASEAADALEAHAAPATAAPTVTLAHLENLRDVMRTEQAQDETAEQRFTRAMASLMKPEAERDDLERRFLKNHLQSSEFRGRWSLFEDFGPSAFGLSDDYAQLLPDGAAFDRLARAQQQGD